MPYQQSVETKTISDIFWTSMQFNRTLTVSFGSTVTSISLQLMNHWKNTDAKHIVNHNKMLILTPVTLVLAHVLESALQHSK